MMDMGQFSQPAKPATSTSITAKTGARYIPTLFFHGYGSHASAEMQMIHAATAAGVTRTVVHATVTKTGRVIWQGHFKRGDYHPLVAVEFKDNRNTDYQVTANWAQKVITGLARTYHIQKFNLVGHSMGNITLLTYLLKRNTDRQMPRPQKWVAIAGNFNGVLGGNDTSQQQTRDQSRRLQTPPNDYRRLAARRAYFPRQVAVLNIYGELNDKTRSDGRVSNASSRSLRLLVQKRAKSYQVRKIMGANAQHSRLHDNQQVDQLLLKFLWP